MSWGVFGKNYDEWYALVAEHNGLRSWKERVWSHTFSRLRQADFSSVTWPQLQAQTQQYAIGVASSVSATSSGYSLTQNCLIQFLVQQKLSSVQHYYCLSVVLLIFSLSSWLHHCTGTTNEISYFSILKAFAFSPSEDCYWDYCVNFCQFIFQQLMAIRGTENYVFYVEQKLGAGSTGTVFYGRHKVFMSYKTSLSCAFVMVNNKYALTWFRIKLSVKTV